MSDREDEVTGLKPVEMTTRLHVKSSFSHIDSVCSCQEHGIWLGVTTIVGLLVAANWLCYVADFPSEEAVAVD